MRVLARNAQVAPAAGPATHDRPPPARNPRPPPPTPGGPPPHPRPPPTTATHDRHPRPPPTTAGSAPPGPPARVYLYQAKPAARAWPSAAARSASAATSERPTP